MRDAKSLQSCLTLWDPIDGSPSGFPVPGILQARTLEWAAISFSSVWKWSRSVVSDFWQLHGLQPTRLRCPWDFPGKSTGVECHCLLHSNSLHICIEECVSVVPAYMLNHHSICGSDTRTHFSFTSWSVFVNTHNPYSSGKYVLKIQNGSFTK